MPPAVVQVTGIIAAAVAVYFGQPWLAVAILSATTISYVASSMFQVPQAADLIAGRMQTLRNATAPHRVVYGKCCISGPLVAAFSYGANNEFVYLVIALTSHEVEGIDDVYLGDTISTDATFIKPDGTSFVQITKHLGAVDQAADADLIANAVDRAGNHVWTLEHTLSGRAYLVIRLEYDQTVFASGLPNVKAVVRGVKDVYDPRTAATGWTDNAVLCVRDYLVKTYGMGAASADVNDANFIAAANICDEAVPVRVGTGAGYMTDGSYYPAGAIGLNLVSGSGTILAGDTITITIAGGTYTIDGVSTVFPASANSYVVETALASGYLVLAGSGLTAAIPPVNCTIDVHTTNQESRYTCNGSFTLDLKPIDIMKKMLTACAGRLVWSQGAYSIFPAAYSYPVGPGLSESDLRDDISVMPAPSRQQRFNTVRGTFVSPAQYWQQVDFPYQQNAAQYAADGSFEICQTLELPYTISASMAQRLAAIFLNQNLRGITVDFPAKLTAFPYQPGDVLNLGIDQLSWSGKGFRCTDWKLSDNGGVDLTLREEDPTIYGWTLTNEKPFSPPAKVRVTSYKQPVDDVTNFTASQNGVFVVFSWDNVAGNIAGYEIRYNRLGNNKWADGTPITQIEKGTHLVSLKAAPGSWTFMICALDALGNYSANPAIYDLAVSNPNFPVIDLVDEATLGWPGTLTNFIVHPSNVLVPLSQGPASGDDWNTFDKFCPVPYSTYGYVALEETLSQNQVVRALAQLVSNLGPGETGVASPQLNIKWHANGAAYNAFQSWDVGDITAIAVTMEAVMTASVGLAYISSFIPMLDMPTRAESGVGISVSHSGTVITYAAPFNFLPNAQATPVGGSGLTAVLSNQTVNGFTLTLYNSAGVAVDGTANWHTQGV